MASVASMAASQAHAADKVNEAAVQTPQFGHALLPEFQRLDNGDIGKTPGVRLAYGRCFACYNQCGVRARIDEKTDTILRLCGNPFCENNTADPLPLSTSVKQSYWMLAGEAGLSRRATTCAKGACSAFSADDERRVTQVLKRAGKRGENRWVTISYEQALQEILEGGDLFGEGPVEGLRAIRQLDKPARPGHPEFGNAANHLMATFCEEDAPRDAIYTRFMRQAWGTSNVGAKHSYCGSAFGSGMALAINPGMEYWLNDVDWDHAEYAIFLGTSPGSSGYSLNSVGRRLADARTARNFKYVCVDPLLRTAVANNTQAQWVPMQPGRDSGLLFAMIQIILDKGWYNDDFLSLTSAESAAENGEINHSNATHLVIDQPGHPNHGKFAVPADLGQTGDGPMVFADGKVQPASAVSHARVLATPSASTAQGETVQLATALSLLKREADRTSLTEYADYCGVEAKVLRQMARDFTHHGRRACIVTSTGANASDSLMIGWLCGILNNLIAAQDAKGGAVYANGGIFGHEGRYDLYTVESGLDISSVVNLCRDGSYESSTEYNEKLAAGHNPYPASDVWHELVPFYNAAEILTSHANANPYQAKAFINWRSNVLYSAASITEEVERSLQDPSRLGLFIGIDSHINETNRYADYLIPDRTMYEEYVAHRMWGAFKWSVVAGAPLITPRTVKDQRGHHVCMEQFLIDVAVALGLPGFGKGSIPVTDGPAKDLLAYEDWHACYLANVAAQCSELPAVTDEDREWAGLERAMAPLAGKLTSTEYQQVEALFSRGGYYDPSPTFDGEFFATGGGKTLQFYHEGVTALRHCYSGEHYPGTPIFHAHKFWNGDSWQQHWPQQQYPVLFSSYKPTVRSPYSVAYDRTDEMSPTNYVYMHPKTAESLGLKDSEPVLIRSANGQPTQGRLQLTDGVAKQAISVSFGFGHTHAFGAEDREIDGTLLPGLKGRAGGLQANRLVPFDPTRTGAASMLIDYWCGDNCRHGVPVKVEKV